MDKYTKSKDLVNRIKDWPEPNFSKDAIGVLEKRYLLKDDASGKIIETPKEALYRVAHVISNVDKMYGDTDIEESEKKFYNLMAEGKFFPNSPTIKGAGLGINLSACYYLPIEDSREGIFKDAFYQAVCVQAYGGGTGFNFSKLRPKNSLISTTKGKASGPVPFMKIFDYGIGPVIAQGGTRNGANMGILDYTHPDIEEFITCKLNGEITNFNISVGIDEKFMKMVENDEEYELFHPKSPIKKKVKAKEIFEKIVNNAWVNGDPGIIFLDRLERDNPTPHIGKIDGTNPCGEQPLLPLEACNLGSINLAKFVEYKEGIPKIDYVNLKNTVNEAVHFLDNVIDANKYPLEKTEKEKKELKGFLEEKIKDSKLVDLVVEDWAQSPIEKMVKGNRKIGLGVMGFADMLSSMNIPYGSKESYDLGEEVMKFIDEESKNASINLAKTRGVFPNWEGSVFDSKSKYFKGKEMKLRNATTTTIAPTGTLSIFSGSSGGIEPLFALAYDRRAVYDQQGKPALEFLVINDKFQEIAKKEKFYDENLFQRIQENKGSIQKMPAPEGITSERWKEIQNLFVTAQDLSPKAHIQIQSIFQKYVDNAVSKTINMPKEATKEDVRQAYMEAYRLGTKGITIYRDGSKKNQVMSVSSQKDKNPFEKNQRPEVIGKTIKQQTPHGSAFITLNVLENKLKEGEVIPYEIFATVGKGGNDISAITEGYGRLLSLLVQKGTSIDEIDEQLRGIGGGTRIGFGESRIYSLPDAISRGIGEAYSKLNNGNGIKREKNVFSGDLCPDCGGALMNSGGCQKCSSPSCGFSRC